MESEIVNKVEKSGLISFDLSEFYPKGERIQIDIKDQLWEGIALKEKDFREFVSSTDWSVYQDKFVAINCSADAIIPHWAYMLLTVSLEPYANEIVFGDKNALEKVICQKTVQALSTDEYMDKRVIIKGCANIPNPEFALVELVKFMTPITKSLMYGEACSTVPLYKKK